MSAKPRLQERPGRSAKCNSFGRSNKSVSSQGWQFRTYIPTPDSQREIISEEESREALRVVKVDLNVSSNTCHHHTSAYEITDPLAECDERHLVIRRGEPFEITVTFNRIYDKEEDDLKFVLEIGDDPKVSKGTQHVLDLNSTLQRRSWGAALLNVNDAKLAVSILVPHSAIIGKWTLRIDSRLSKSEDRSMLRYTHATPVYVLFNPWCKDDQVYLAGDIERDECVLNDTGTIFTGNVKQITSKPWNFGQFEDFMLDCALYLIEKSNLSITVRHNAVNVTRSLSKIINGVESCVLEGNWCGNYSDGTGPSAWVGSVAILEQFMKTKTPVKYGQCWVFAAVLTSVCRCLGIPCRLVTSYCSAHDCDGNMTVDTHWGQNRELLDELNEDSVWTFHIWNEVWMARPDLGEHLQHYFGGWQAVDPTPQETTSGICTAGPTPVVAIKRGEVNIPFDTPFLFAEVNADKVHWIRNSDNTWRWIAQKHHTGRKLSTCRPRLAPERVIDPFQARIDGETCLNPHREDLTHNYKYPGGSEEERAALYKASTGSSVPKVKDKNEGDVDFTVTQKAAVPVGSPFDVIIHMQNKSRSVRKISLTMCLTSIHYTGVPCARVKVRSFDLQLPALRAEEAVMRVIPEEYLHLLVDQASFRISVFGQVEQTEQTYVGYEDFRLIRPEITVEAPKQAHTGQDIKCKVKFQNTLPAHLTQCEWQIEGPGIQRTKCIPHKYGVEPFDKAQVEVTLTPTRAGEKRKILASFHSKELMDVTGSCTIDIHS